MKKWCTLLFAGCLSQTISFSQIPNNDFESWTNVGGWFENPESWQTNNTQITIAQVNKDSDAYSGTFAARLTNYTSIIPFLHTGFPVTAHPAHLNAYVKSMINGNDSVSVRVILYHSGAAVDSGKWIGYFGNSGYSLVSIPITNSTSDADSAAIEIYGGTQYGTDLKIDDLEFDYELNGIAVPADKCDISVLQNPFHESIQLNICPGSRGIMEVHFYDVTGRLLQSTSFFNNNQSILSIDVSMLPEGIYICTLKQDDQRKLLKLLKQ